MHVQDLGRVFVSKVRVLYMQLYVLFSVPCCALLLLAAEHTLVALITFSSRPFPPPWTIRWEEALAVPPSNRYLWTADDDHRPILFTSSMSEVEAPPILKQWIMKRSGGKPTPVAASCSRCWISTLRMTRPELHLNRGFRLSAWPSWNLIVHTFLMASISAWTGQRYSCPVA